ncbi:sigma-70 family RNA polymerase sigma factor [bacterium]|nr:sigma-70 family RNA polymerase sigma factor [bacterium]
MNRPHSALQDLVERLRKGDSTALEPLIEATRGMASRLAYSIVHDHYRSEDVLQDVYVTVYQKIGQLREPAAFNAWFTRIIVNRCRSELKRSQDLLSEDEEETADPRSDSMHTRLEVRDALQELVRADRVVLVLREMLELSYEEIAETLGVPVGTVRSRIFNARQRLLKLIQKGRSLS